MQSILFIVLLQAHYLFPHTAHTMTSSSAQSSLPRLWYAYDALCGWCYGFSPVMQELYREYASVLEFEVFSGGMIRGDRIGAIGEVAPYISWAYKHVEERTGVVFGEKFLHGVLAEGTAIFTSIPAALAMAVLKRSKPLQALAFAHRLQTAIYFDGIQPSRYEVYGEYAQEFGFDAKEFTEQMRQPATLEAAEAEFALCARLGITGFPTVLLQQGQTLTLLAQGYTDAHMLKERINTLLQRDTTTA